MSKHFVEIQSKKVSGNYWNFGVSKGVFKNVVYIPSH